ncbi:MAG TPA: DUF881 domain-containing protein [Actinomycetota bacterium]|nr:DUF881 domain-containing protein [Actinomycetota bacterium]
MNRPVPPNLLDRLMAEAQADDYALAQEQAPTTRGSLVVAAGLLAVIGFLLAVAFWQHEAVQPAAADRRQVLIDRVESAEERAQESQAKAADLRASVSQLQKLASSGLGEDFADQLRAVEIASGFVALTGPGVILTVDDAHPPLPAGVEPDEARVLDIDLQLAVNGLWEAGAQAVAINDVRLTSVTAIRTAGEAILVDYRPLEPPYRISAIGPPDLAEVFAGTETAGDLKQLGRDYGIQSDVRSVREVNVPASTANLPVRAEVVKGASP